MVDTDTKYPSAHVSVQGSKIRKILYAHPDTFKGVFTSCILCGRPIQQGKKCFKIGFQLTSCKRWAHEICYSRTSRNDLRDIFEEVIRRGYSSKSWFNNGVGYER